MKSAFTPIACLLVSLISIAVAYPADTTANAHGASQAGHTSSVSSNSDQSLNSHETASTTRSTPDIDLVADDKLQALDAARHQKMELAEVELASISSSRSRIIMEGCLAVLLGILGFLLLRSGIFKRASLARKLGIGFGAMTILAIAVGVVGFHYLRSVTDASHLEIAFIDLDMMANETATLQDEFILHGIEDRDLGESILKTHSDILTEYKTDMQTIQNLFVLAEVIIACP